MKWNIYRLLAFLLLIALSIGFGLGFDQVATAIERRQYPQDAATSSLIAESAERYSVPETVLYAAVRTQSRFVSNTVSEDGRIGLIQLHPDTFAFISKELLNKEKTESGMLYDPATNIEAGAAYISYLFERYGVWDTVYAAFYIGTDTVDAWLANAELVTPQGTLAQIPDERTDAFVKDMRRAVELYHQLYYK